MPDQSHWAIRWAPLVFRFLLRSIQFRVAFALMSVGVTALAPSLLLVFLNWAGLSVPSQTEWVVMTIGGMLLFAGLIWMAMLVRQDLHDRSEQLQMSFVSGNTDNWVHFDGT